MIAELSRKHITNHRGIQKEIEFLFD